MADQADQADSLPAVDESHIAATRERRNSLEQHLKQRPGRSELVERNILPASTAAPGLQERQKELAKHMRADSLNDKISHRPPPEKLLEDGVLHDDPRSPEEKYAEAIEDEYAKREGGA
ncbi:hypothetical protein GGS23DRAFT_311554 [Durotheca rogersii]|uniref:uncharacterized protein n=1 Tax=Durotheca rogersii TaxID=419775 RepID=UPI00221F5297|nr:uncharacterized protein GGS23DRAFT_311554 [Durotheca rogersii]KAI5859697.1 hypothetical protein GGS23DRAFT_311554 [Durotheca rogersii]